MAGWFGAKGRANFAKIAKTCPFFDVTNREPKTQNEIKIFYLN